MGFLLGAFGKLAAGSRYRQLQAQMMRIQSRARRASRDVANMTKLLDRQEKSMLNNLTAGSSTIINQAQKGIIGTMGIEEILNKSNGGGKLSEEETQKLGQYQQAMTLMKTQQESSIAVQKQMIQDYVEQLRETQLEPLKDEEDSLQLEKESLESQVQLAKMDYEACKEMEKTDAQMLKPSYTGAA